MIRDHLRVLRVIKDSGGRFGVSKEEAHNDLASDHQIRIPKVKFSQRTLRKSVLFEELLIDSIGPLPTDQLCNRVHLIDVGHRLEETVT